MVGNANSFGLMLTFIIPVLAAGYFVARSAWLKMLLLMALGVGIFALFMSWSRASWLSVIVQGLTIAVLLKKRVVIVGGLVAFLVAVTVIMAIPTTRNLAFNALRLQAGTTHRTILWNAGTEAVLESPLVGYGFGLRVGEVIPDVQWSDWVEAFVFRSSTDPYYPHNLYIHLALSAGIPGLILFLAMVGTLIRRHYRAGRGAPSRGLKVAHFTIVGMVVGALFNGMFEGAALIGKGAINNYFWIAVGLTAAYDRLTQIESADVHRS